MYKISSRDSKSAFARKEIGAQTGSLCARLQEHMLRLTSCQPNLILSLASLHRVCAQLLTTSRATTHEPRVTTVIITIVNAITTTISSQA